MKNALHFVGFKDDRVHNALRVFGQPDFWHRRWDYRAVCEVVDGDTVVFATGDEHSPVDPHAFDDSANTPEPPAFKRMKFGSNWFTVYTEEDGSKTAVPDDPAWMQPAIDRCVEQYQPRKGKR